MESKRLQLPKKSTVVEIKIKLHVLKVLKSSHCTKSKRRKTKNQRIIFQGAKNQKNQKGTLFKHQNQRKIKTSKFKQNDELSSQKVEHVENLLLMFEIAENPEKMPLMRSQNEQAKK